MTKTEFVEWKNHPTTVEVFRLLTAARDDYKEFLANGGTVVKDSNVSTEMLVGRIQGLNDFLLIQYEEAPEERREAYGH
jgi:hypothetical protein